MAKRVIVADIEEKSASIERLLRHPKTCELASFSVALVLVEHHAIPKVVSRRAKGTASMVLENRPRKAFGRRRDADTLKQ